MEYSVFRKLLFQPNGEQPDTLPSLSWGKTQMEGEAGQKERKESLQGVQNEWQTFLQSFLEGAKTLTIKIRKDRLGDKARLFLKTTKKLGKL